MSNILEELKKYFESTPREKVMSDWAKAKDLAPKGGPKLSEFLAVMKIYYQPDKNSFVIIDTNDNLANPDYSPGFLFNQLFNYEYKCFISVNGLYNQSC